MKNVQINISIPETWKKELENLTKDAGITNIRFLPFQPDIRLNELQNTADAGLVTLRTNSGISSVPSKVLGYMAAGRPVIASAAERSDTARLIREVPCGLTCPPQDPQALADTIETMANENSLRLEFGQNARRYTVNQFLRERIVDQYERLILG